MLPRFSPVADTLASIAVLASLLSWQYPLSAVVIAVAHVAMRVAVARMGGRVSDPPPPPPALQSEGEAEAAEVSGEDGRDQASREAEDSEDTGDTQAEPYPARVQMEGVATQTSLVMVFVCLVLALLSAAMWYTEPRLLLRMGDNLAPWLPWRPLSDHSPLAMAVFVLAAVAGAGAPFAFALSVPSCLGFGHRAARERGISFRDDGALQTLRDASIVVFSRSGAFVAGDSKVTDVSPAEESTLPELLGIAAALAQHSRHRVATAIVEAARRERLSLPEAAEVLEYSGRGMWGLVEGAPVLMGKESWLRAQGVNTAPLSHTLYELHHGAKTTVLVARGGRVLGVLAVVDRLKKDSVRALKILKRMELRCVLLTGDSKETARLVAEQLGITEVIADVTPHERAAAVAKLNQETIRRVIMVGDARDAEAMAAADAGITFSPVENAAVTLPGDGLMDVVTAMQLAKESCNQGIRAYFWAMGYHAVVLVLAMSGLLHPMLAGMLSAAVIVGTVRYARQLLRFDTDRYSAEVLRR
jgi:P-type E1-E2 ATPase